MCHIGNGIELTSFGREEESGSLKLSGKFNYGPYPSNTLNVQEALSFFLKEDSPYTRFLYYDLHF